jgi:hypothetical protein
VEFYLFLESLESQLGKLPNICPEFLHFWGSEAYEPGQLSNWCSQAPTGHICPAVNALGMIGAGLNSEHRLSPHEA